MTYEDKWIVSKCNTIIQEVSNNLNNFDLGVALQKIYDFIWNEFCDWYIEMVKTRLYNKDCPTRKAAQYTLNKVLSTVLKLLHPFMPFITEEIYQKLYGVEESIMLSRFPEYNPKLAWEKEEKQIEKLKQIIIGIRNVRTNLNVHPSKKSELIFVTKEEDLIRSSEEFLQKLGFADSIKVQENKAGIQANALSVVTDGIEAYIPFEELVDIEAEKVRLQEEKKKLVAEVERVDKMLSNPGFMSKAPKEKIEAEKAKQQKYQEMLQAVEERIKEMEK